MKVYHVKGADDDVIATFIDKWQMKYPDCTYYEASCQDFVRDFDVEIRTQKDILMEWATIIFKACTFFFCAFLSLLLAYIILWVLVQRAEKLEKGEKGNLLP